MARIRLPVAMEQASACSSDLTPGWELLYATGVAIKKKKRIKKERNAEFGAFLTSHGNWSVCVCVCVCIQHD